MASDIQRGLAHPKRKILSFTHANKTKEIFLSSYKVNGVQKQQKIVLFFMKSTEKPVSCFNFVHT